MLQDFQDFDDPGLKAALGRALPMESAPPELRRRLIELVVQAAAESAARAEHAGHNGQAARSQSPLDPPGAGAHRFLPEGQFEVAELCSVHHRPVGQSGICGTGDG